MIRALVIVAASWTIAATVGAAGFSFAATRLKRLRGEPSPPWYVTSGLWTFPDPDAPEVNLMVGLPPVPPSRDPLDVELEALLASDQ